MGTPPAKPFACKKRFFQNDAVFNNRRADPTGGEPRLSHVAFIAGISDIIPMSSQFVPNAVPSIMYVNSCNGAGKQKTLLPLGKQG